MTQHLDMYGIRPRNGGGWTVTLNGEPIGRQHISRMDAHNARNAILRSLGFLSNDFHYTDTQPDLLAEMIEACHE